MPRSDRSGESCLEDLVQLPFEELAGGPVRGALGQFDDLPGLGVELVSVAELRSQPGTDVQAVARVDAEVAAVKQGVDVRSQQEPVVEPVLAALGDRAMCAASRTGGI
jgi:hypothetical protein